MPDSFKTYLPWLILREIPLLGNTMFKRLIDHFHSPEAILNAPQKDLAQIYRMSDPVITGIQMHEKFADAARKELHRIMNCQAKIVTLTDPDYPPLLKQISDPPPFLTYLGTLDRSAPCISIIGSRSATRYGLNTAGNLAYQLAKRGFQIVSGMALGIDAMAHKGALKADGRTIAVLGSGLNRIYPRSHTELFRRIVRNGTIFSEFKVDTDPLPAHFPMRNRIIAGLSCGSVVVEAAKKSGSLITARLANDYNREVFAVPGSIASRTSQGTHALLKQGAKLVETQMDILDELGHFVHEKKENPSAPPLQRRNQSQYKENVLMPDADRVLQLLEPYPVHMDDLIEKSGMSTSKLSALLFELEMQRKVIRHQGNYYSISEENH